MLVCFVKLIGSPDDASLGFLRSNNARRYVRQLPQYPKQQFSAKFQNAAPGALDLLERMLVFDPSKRITGILVSLSTLPLSNSVDLYSCHRISCRCGPYICGNIIPFQQEVYNLYFFYFFTFKNLNREY